MSNEMSNDRNQLTNGKLLAGAIAAPIMTYVFWSMSGLTMCSGILLFTTIAAWVLIYLRARAMVRSITGGRTRRHFMPIESQPATPLQPPTAQDSRSAFL